MLALSVSISTSSCPRATWSPSATSQRRIVPCSIESDSRGITISAAVLVAALLIAFSADQVECGAGDLLGVDAEVAVEVLHIAGLPEVLHAEAGDRRVVDGAEEGQRVRMAVEHGHERRGASDGEQLLEHCVVA